MFIYLLVKNSLNLIKKEEKKSEDLINKKSPKLDKKTKSKTNNLLFYTFIL